MAKRVVDLLEPVEVDVEDGEFLPLAPPVEGQPFKRDIKLAAVGKRRQRVVQRIVLDAVLGDLEFNALNYDYRELSGARTQFKGAGKVNNEAGFKYILTVVDGQAPQGGGVDKFRLKIWNEKTGAVIFDNQSGAADDAEPTAEIGSGDSISFPK